MVLENNFSPQKGPSSVYKIEAEAKLTKRELDSMKSPEFKHNDYEPILEWAEAKVEYNDEFVSDGIITKMPEYGSYSLIWKNGVMHLDYDKDQEEKARKCAALFIYLWTRGVDCSIAINCARSYVDNVIIRSI